MHLHEYQAKELLEKGGVPVPPFFVATSLSEVKKELTVRGWSSAVVKIQVHAGGRGKAGGVKIGKTREEVEKWAEKLIGMKMVGPQTGKEGVIARCVLITEPVTIAREAYLSLLIDRALGRLIVIASPFGGMEIEELAEKNPEKILKMALPLSGKLRAYHKVRLAKFMGWQGKTREIGSKLVQDLATIFLKTDATLIEINPLAEDASGHLLALDAKMTLDDNALYRQEMLRSAYDVNELTLNEQLAREHELAYIALEGNIGCMVNGAGLAMATMDLIEQYGGKPANFLDVGGGASKEKVAAGFKIILSDPQVKAILVNIFGGIMDCGVLADGIVAAVREMGIEVPLVVRMEGTHVEIGKKILEESGLKITSAHSLKEAAEKIAAVI